MKTVPLTNSDQVALVDDQDFELVSQYQWALHAKGYAYCRFWDKEAKRPHTVYMHKLIADGIEIDHARKNKLDNRRSELRGCTRQQNASNMAKHRDGASRFKGVSPHYWTRRKTGERVFQGWCAHICKEGKRMYLGVFGSDVDAARAYDAAARRLFGDFALINGV